MRMLPHLPPAGGITPGSASFLNAPIKPAVIRPVESPRQRKIWYALMAAGHSSAAFDAWSTRRAISGGYGTEGDPLMRPFAHSGAMYAATQVSPAVMDLSGTPHDEQQSWLDAAFLVVAAGGRSQLLVWSRHSQLSRRALRFRRFYLPTTIRTKVPGFIVGRRSPSFGGFMSAAGKTTLWVLRSRPIVRALFLVGTFSSTE